VRKSWRLTGGTTAAVSAFSRARRPSRWSIAAVIEVPPLPLASDSTRRLISPWTLAISRDRSGTLEAFLSRASSASLIRRHRRSRSLMTSSSSTPITALSSRSIGTPPTFEQNSAPLCILPKQ